MTLPLEHIRIIDLTGMLAGPYATRLLADMGAQVVKVESLHRYDLTRGPAGGDARARVYPNNDPGDRPFDRSSYFNEMNRNKLGLTLDLRSERGHELFLRLLEISDAVIENFSAGVMERLGLGYETLRSVRPDIVMVSMPAFGNTGPWRDAVAYGNTIEMMSGLASLNGYEDSLPITSSFTYGDPVAGVHAAYALLAALEWRERSGEGQFVDLSQLETLSQFVGPDVIAYGLTGEVEGRRGNRDREHAPHGVYPSSQKGQWLAIAVTTEGEWANLCRVARLDSTDERFSTASMRKVNEDALDALIEQWSRTLEADEAARTLRDAGVPASGVHAAKDTSRDPQVLAFGYQETVTHRQAGTHAYPGLPWHMSGVDRAIRSPAPGLGEHSRYVLCDLLGLTEKEFDELATSGVTGENPLSPD